VQAKQNKNKNVLVMILAVKAARDDCKLFLPRPNAGTKCAKMK
jgi:hypothetical protein